MSDYPKIQPEISQPISENLQKLADLFPAAVKDGELDIEALREELGDFAEIQPGDEKYELNWVGKQAAKKKAFEPLLGKTLALKDDGKNTDTTENLYIEGDNLEALKLLRQNYYGEVKMIYIDPPYNTGKDFVYADNFNISGQESDEAEGLVSEGGELLVKNEKSSNRYHARWLDMMYPRLRLSKDLLREDGLVFISIDNNEAANLIAIGNEVFGEDSFVTCIHVEMSATQGMKVKAAKQGNLVKNGELILIYSKNKSKNIGKKPLLSPSEYDGHYSLFMEKKSTNSFIETSLASKVREDKELIAELLTLKLIKAKDAAIDLKKCYQTSPRFKKFIHSNADSITRVHDSVDIPESFTKNINDNNVYIYNSTTRTYLIARSDNGNYYQRIRLSDKLSFADDFNRTYGPSRIRGDWWPGFYLDMGNISKEGGVIFKNGKKPVRLIKQIINFVTETDDTILDFFSGSATTAHAVNELNAEDGGTRKHIMIQVPATIELSSEEAKAGYKTITDIGKQRIRRAGDKIKAELSEKAKNANSKEKAANPYLSDPDSLDTGFKVFHIEDTKINWLKKDLRGEDLEAEAGLTTADALDFVPGFTDTDVVYELLLRQSNIPLTLPITQPIDGSGRTYLYGDSYLICLEETIDKELVEQLAALEPTPLKYFFRDSAFGKDIAFKDETFRRLNAEIAKNTADQADAYTVEFI